MGIYHTVGHTVNIVIGHHFPTIGLAQGCLVQILRNPLPAQAFYLRLNGGRHLPGVRALAVKDNGFIPVAVKILRREFAADQSSVKQVFIERRGITGHNLQQQIGENNGLYVLLRLGAGFFITKGEHRNGGSQMTFLIVLHDLSRFRQERPLYRHIGCRF